MLLFTTTTLIMTVLCVASSRWLKKQLYWEQRSKLWQGFLKACAGPPPLTTPSCSGHRDLAFPPGPMISSDPEVLAPLSFLLRVFLYQIHLCLRYFYCYEAPHQSSLQKDEFIWLAVHYGREVMTAGAWGGWSWLLQSGSKGSWLLWLCLLSLLSCLYSV